MKFAGYISDQRSPLYAAFLLPIVTIKNGIDFVRKSIHKLIWSELTQNSSQDSDPLQELITIITFGFFCLVCIVSYKFNGYYPSISLFFAGCWYLDLILSKQHYARKIPVELTLTKDNYYLWQLKSGELQKFHRSNLIGVGISQKQVLSGVFSTAIANPWQIFLLLENGTKLIIHEEIHTKKALAKAKELAKILETPMSFLNAQTNIENDKSIKQNLNQKLDRGGAIALHKTRSKWHIFSQWTAASSGYFFGKVFNESGFLLFVLFLTEFMSRFGNVIDTIISTYRQEGIIYLDFGNLISNYSFGWIKILEVAIALGIMIWRGIQISQVKHIYIDSNHLSYGINRKAIAQLNLATIENLVLINQPQQSVLVFDHEAAIEIKDLLVNRDYEDLFLALEAGIDNFKNESA